MVDRKARCGIRAGRSPMDVRRVRAGLELDANGRKGGKVWREKFDRFGAVVRDYGVVSRLLEPRTGQFTVILAGLGTNGTEAATEFVTNESILEVALGNAPRDWQTKNMQIMLETNVTNSVPGPPHVVAAYHW